MRGRAIVIFDHSTRFALSALSPRVKKLIGAIAMLIWIPLYALIAMGFGVHILPHAGALATFLYYAIAGTIWIVPIGLMLPWMNREKGK